MDYLKKNKLDIVKNINKIFKKEQVAVTDFVYPPDNKMGDISLPCFNLAKKSKKNPVEVAQFLNDKLLPNSVIKSITNIGPYLNFIFYTNSIASKIIKSVGKKESKYGKVNIGNSKKIMIEYAHPNTHKAFHIGHLRTAVTGDAIARILEALGYNIIRANYQGDVGPHVAKCIWGVLKLESEYNKNIKANLDKRIEFLGKAYVLGSKNYEKDKKIKDEIIELNKKIYKKDKKIIKIYNNTRKWSLDYFANIYKKLDTKFDRLYFESEVFEQGKKIVLANLDTKVFTKSKGAIIFEGEKHGLHDRVFVNSQGFPTYEAKELELARLQNKEYSPKKIIHVVASEQEEYFKVVFCALSKIFPKIASKEEHLSYAMVDLKNGKMSSRRGNVVLGEWLLDEVNKKILKIISKNKDLKNKEVLSKKISLGAIKYFILKNGINKKILFDINESVSLSGNSGPYLQYTYVRIKSIEKKIENSKKKIEVNLENLKEFKEHKLILEVAKYPEIVLKAGENYDPSEIAKYLFELCKLFNDYYHTTPILKAEVDIRNARLALITSVGQVIENGLDLLGIGVVEEM